ncbi:glycosyltransferase [Mucilaginibacter achroorhodeus]|uniref:glycosyltransferase n=1 Tax=Mucilaginibacter achroorhodeus TaxID=2599294 RepID=UPI00164527D3|nr:glycosyltransferase [Mucilaginibacter achroorhodeus]
MKISVIICTYNPRLQYLEQVLLALRNQTLVNTEWELLIIDNKSSNQFTQELDLSWHANAKVMREEQAGLAHARLKGFKNSIAELIVFVDDDNVLADNYLELSWDFYLSNPQVGCFGGKSVAVFETTPPAWFWKTGISLGCKDDGDEIYISDYRSDNYKLQNYPDKAPIGTGMVITKKAFKAYYLEVLNNADRLALGRKGKALTSGEDNDIVLTIIKNYFEIAYIPKLVVKHLIPTNRISTAYLKQMAYESNKSWITLLRHHGICPFKTIPQWTVRLRKVKAWFKYKVWQSPVNIIKWHGACGTFESLADG